ncbi:MHS family MFS transporter [Campylobacter lari]|uniref:MFS transporter n=1 Tax=Campylobacter lari TaxID=201 RepID=UPI00057F58E4|nr:MFS transporter [Campylobacter lari]AJC89121.1 major facilitator family transporter CjaB [Campylobacter lari subsp. concheus LMG 11760]EAH8850684.1 MFS transporter [Campylobacter lari]EAH9952522.1 MFS transporter [Campylobacter lari]EAI1236477.1 MFS transporter [Campylobacter lari]EAI4304970.1 MHS family MFS transporter [Campylobacter lari]
MQKAFKNTIYASLGGILEFYDFVLFIFFASVFAKIFFPQNDDFWPLIYTYVAFGAGYLARPFGAVVLAHFADIKGRKNVFYISMLLMVVPSFVLAFLPTYESIGLFATFMLFIIRIAQGLAIGAEVSGAWIFVSEFVSKKRLGLALGFISATLTLGLLLGNLATLSIYAYFDKEEVESFAWRIPFFIGGFFGILALFLRTKLNETPAFKNIKEKEKILNFPLLQALKTHKKSMLICAFLTVVLTSGVATLMILPQYFESLLGVSKTTALLYQNLAIVMIILGSLVQGYLADFLGHFRICLIFTVVFGAFGISFSFYNEWFLSFYLLACFAQGIIAFAPIFMTQIFTTELRSSGLSFAYNVSYAILGFLTPFVVNFMYEKYFYIYIIFIVIASLLSMFLIKVFLKQKPALKTINYKL